MVTHADAQPGGKPEQKKHDGQIGPTEHKKGGDSPRMQNQQDDNGWPIQSLVAKLVEIGDHRLFQGYRHYDSTLTGIARVVCKTSVISGGYRTLARGVGHWRG